VKFPWFMAGSLAAMLAANPLFAQLGPNEPTRSSATQLDRIKIGQTAPEFALENVEGQTVQLSKFHGKKAVVLVFYRGYW